MNENKTETVDRAHAIEQLKTKPFDILIIGGGITGAGIALDAASRGLKTALIEKNDFAFGTSSRSTKLIHGGLRYLKQLEFGLVKEVGSERAVVHRLAPHLVVPEKMLLPLYEKRGFGSILTSFGLKLYDFLAGVKPEDQRRMLTRSQTLKQEPLLGEADVKGGAIYAEYRTDDARLTIEIIKTAMQYGACAANYCEATGFLYEQGKIDGVRAIDHLTHQTFSIQATVVVNATGPWVDTLRDINGSKQGKRLHLTKGVHLVVAHEKFPVRQAIYFDVDDGRMIFAIPRGRTTYIGTTDTNYLGSLDDVSCSKEDAEYLIRAVNRTFPAVALTLSDVESSWAGLRPLIHEEGKTASELSRKDEIFESGSGLISIAGGKLTGYRKMAERIVDRVLKKYFPERWVGCKTQHIPFTGAGFKNYKEVKEYIAAIAFALRPFGLEEEAHYLVGNYGKQADEVIRHLEDTHAEHPRLQLMLAELKFCTDHEMAVKPADFFIRRTGLLYFNRQLVDQFGLEVLRALKKINHWPDILYDAEKKELEKLIEQVTEFN
jgi:glycerol-3-phosphate dehydrogenase